MKQSVLTIWSLKFVSLVNVVSKFALALGLIASIVALVVSLFGGKLGPISLDAEWRLLAPATLSFIAHSIGLIMISSRLGTLLSSLNEGDPFIPENAKRLRDIAFILGGLELFRYFTKGLTAIILAIFGQPEDGTIGINIHPSFVAWGAVIVLFLLSEAFREGARLRQLDKLTI